MGADLIGHYGTPRIRQPRRMMMQLTATVFIESSVPVVTAHPKSDGHPDFVTVEIAGLTVHVQTLDEVQCMRDAFHVAGKQLKVLLLAGEDQEPASRG